MHTRSKQDWEKLFAFENEADKAEHEADMLSLKIALEITKLLEENGISKKEFAKLMGTSSAYITQVLRGDKRINMLFLAKVIKAMNVKLDIGFPRGVESDRELLDEVLNSAISSVVRPSRDCAFDAFIGLAASGRR